MTDQRLPGFIVVGPPRTATTWLDRALRGHVNLPAAVKETHFFARNYSRGIDWYAEHFHAANAGQSIGEICAAYFENPQARERIHQHLPGCKIICTLRDPADRLYSYYKLMRQGGRTSLSFELALHSYPKLLRFSRYATLLRQWRRQFGNDQVLAVLNEDLVDDPQAYLAKITEFIGAEAIQLDERVTGRTRQNAIDRAPRSNVLAKGARVARSWMGAQGLYRARSFLGQAGVWRFCAGGGEAFPPMAADTRRWIQQQLRPEIEDLEDLLDRDLSSWKDLARARDKESQLDPAPHV